MHIMKLVQVARQEIVDTSVSRSPVQPQCGAGSLVERLRWGSEVHGARPASSLTTNLH